MSYIGILLLMVVGGGILVIAIRAMLDKDFLTSSFLGVGSLIVVSTLFSSQTALLAVNIITIAAAFFLGVPGVVGMLLLRLITMV